MVSNTRKKEMKQIRKRSSGGKGRKRETRDGTTPRFPVHVEDAPDAVLPQPPGSLPQPV